MFASSSSSSLATQREGGRNSLVPGAIIETDRTELLPGDGEGLSDG